MLSYLLMKGRHTKLRYRSMHSFTEDSLRRKLKLHVLGYRTSYTGPCSPAQEAVGAENMEMSRTLCQSILFTPELCTFPLLGLEESTDILDFFLT